MSICYIILTHKITEELIEYVNKQNIYIVILNTNYKQLHSKYDMMFTNEKDYIGNGIFPIIEFSKHHNYDYYIVQEYDAKYTGNYEDLINLPDCDLMLQSNTESCENWTWDYYTYIPEYNKVHCLLNWYKISKKALEYIEKKYQEGWYGHYECIVPTAILNNSEFKVDYLNKYINVITDWDVDTFKNKLYKHLCENKSLDNCLLHPIKT